MSSILKALRKLEEEKARREDGRVDIARDILRGSRGRDLRPVGLLWFIAGVVLLGAGLAIGVLLFWPGHSEQGPSPALGMPELAPARERASNPPPTTFPPFSLAGPAPIAGQNRTRPDPDLNAPTPTAVPASRPGIPQTDPEPATGKGGAHTPAPASLEPGVDRGLTLNGIAYQDDPAARLAIINGLPVMEGTLVEGALVEKILPDRVIISREGEATELRIEGGESR